MLRFQAIANEVPFAVRVAAMRTLRVPLSASAARVPPLTRRPNFAQKAAFSAAAKPSVCVATAALKQHNKPHLSPAIKACAHASGKKPSLDANAPSLKPQAIKDATAVAEEKLDEMMTRMKKAQAIFATYTQEQVDYIVSEVALEATKLRIPLAKLAVEDTKMGVVEDKIIKNHFAAEYVFHKYEHELTCDVIYQDKISGFAKVASPVGPVAALIPTTNPTSTVIYKTLLCLKTRNCVMHMPHPRAARSSAAAVEALYKVALRAGAPADCIMYISKPTAALAKRLISHPQVRFLMATGGNEMVQACYSSGKPAVGVGAGNVPVLVDETADIRMTAASVLMSKSFDNGVICASEQCVVAVDKVYDQLKAEFERIGAYVLTPEEAPKVGKLVVTAENRINPDIIGQHPHVIAKMAGLDPSSKACSTSTRALLAEIKEIGPNEPMSREKLSPVLAMIRVPDFKAGLDIAEKVVRYEGMGHTAVFYTNPKNRDRVYEFQHRMPAGRILLNQPSSFGAIGDVYNFELGPALMLGVGTWGGSATSENVGPRHLLNIKQVADRRENMLWFKVPQSIYFKKGILKEALSDVSDLKSAFIVTDPVVAQMHVPRVEAVLKSMGMRVFVFSDVKPNPLVSTVMEGVRDMKGFNPDLLICIGGGSALDAGKMMRLMYEHRQLSFEQCAARFMDIRKKVVRYPAIGTKIRKVIAIPTTSGTGAEVTPFVVITEDGTGRKFPIADYSLTPDMAIVDPDFVMSMPPALTAHTGLDALTHALESHVSIMATPYTTGLSSKAIQAVFQYLPLAHKEPDNEEARHRMHDASTMAGMAFANAFLGICHSMAHTLGSTFKIPHGLANAVMLSHVIAFNTTESPAKQATFPQYRYYKALEQYAVMTDRLRLDPDNKHPQPIQKVQCLIDAIEKLKAEVGVPAAIKELVPSESEYLKAIPAMAETAFDDQCTAANPRFPLMHELAALLKAAYYGPPARLVSTAKEAPAS